jgi:sugar phosphate isomerase/epimerase
MARVPIALQLYSVREDCQRDFAGALKAVAKMGYEGVEFAGIYGPSPTETRKMLDALGLKVAGAHIGLDALLGDQFKRTVEFHRTLGNQFLIAPGLPEERRNSKAAWRETGRLFSEIAEKLKSFGMKPGSHNHAVEVSPIEGEIAWDVFFSNCSPAVVMQLDTGNALHAGMDPVRMLEKHPGRAVTVHLKEDSKTNDKALVGEGDVRWTDVFTLCETTGATQWYIVEQESYPYSPLECVDRCLKWLRAQGK